MEHPPSDPMDWHEQTPPRAEDLSSNPASIRYFGSGYLNNNFNTLTTQSTRSSTRRPQPLLTFEERQHIERLRNRRIAPGTPPAHLAGYYHTSLWTRYTRPASTQARLDSDILRALRGTTPSNPSVNISRTRNLNPLFTTNPSRNRESSLKRLDIDRDPESRARARINLWGGQGNPLLNQNIHQPATGGLFNTTPTLGRRPFHEFAEGEVVATQAGEAHQPFIRKLPAPQPRFEHTQPTVINRPNTQDLVPGAFPAEDTNMINGIQMDLPQQRGQNNMGINELQHHQEPNSHLIHRAGVTFTNALSRFCNIVLRSTHVIRSAAQTTGRYAFERRHHIRDGYHATAQATRRIAPRGEQVVIHSYRAAVHGATEFKRRLVEFTNVRRQRNVAVAGQPVAANAEPIGVDVPANIDVRALEGAPPDGVNVAEPQGEPLAAAVEQALPVTHVVERRRDKAQEASVEQVLREINRRKLALEKAAAEEAARREHVDQKLQGRRASKEVVRDARNNPTDSSPKTENNPDVQGSEKENERSSPRSPASRRELRLRRERRPRANITPSASSQGDSLPVDVTASLTTSGNGAIQQTPAMAVAPSSDDAGPVEQISERTTQRILAAPVTRGVQASSAAQAPLIPLEQSSPLSSLQDSPLAASSPEAQDTAPSDLFHGIPSGVHGPRQVHFFESPNSGQPVDRVNVYEDPSMTDIAEDETSVNAEMEDGVEEEALDEDGDVEEVSVDEDSIDEKSVDEESDDEGSDSTESVVEQSETDESSGGEGADGENINDDDSDQEDPIDYDSIEGHGTDEGLDGEDSADHDLNEGHAIEQSLVEETTVVDEPVESASSEHSEGSRAAQTDHRSGNNDQEVKIVEPTTEAVRSSPTKDTMTLPVTPPVIRQFDYLNISGRRVSSREQEKEARRAAEVEARRAEREAKELAAQWAREEREAKERERKKREDEEKAAKEAEEARLRAEEAAALRRLLGRRTPAGPVFNPLSNEWHEKVDRAMATGYGHTIATTSGGTPLDRRDMGRLLPQPGTGDPSRGWLNDEIVNACLLALTTYGLEKVKHKRGETPKYHAFPNGFYTKLIDPNQGPSSVQRWASRARVGGRNLEKVEHIFIPCNLDNMHWTLLVVHGTRRVVEYFDSFNGEGERYLQTAREWLQFELGDAYHEDEWKYVTADSPNQHNGSDCGVFAVTSARMILLGLEPAMAYGANDIRMHRKRIVAELMNGGLNGEFEPRAA